MAIEKRTIRKIQLAHKILQLANQHNWQINHHLTEIKLSNMLGVSRSPVRAALNQLVEWGAVENRPYQGFFLRVEGDQLLGLGQQVPPTLEEGLYLELIEARIDGRIGEIATQVEIISTLNSSRTSVERVLSRMVDEGLMERLKGRGWQFLPAFDSSQSAACGYQLRMLIEPGGILLPQFQVDHEKLAACRIAHLDLLSVVEIGNNPASWVYSIDAEFHEMIASFSKNVFFLQAIQHQNRLRRLLEYRGYSNCRRISDWCHEHLVVIDALERHQFGRAAQLMRTHLENAVSVT